MVHITPVKQYSKAHKFKNVYQFLNSWSHVTERKYMHTEIQIAMDSYRYVFHDSDEW